ncbi:MAG: hypothetical protein ACOCT0_06720 [Halobacteriota archaeon]
MRTHTAVALACIAVVATGCLHGAPQAGLDEALDRETTSYTVESTTTIEVSASDAPGVTNEMQRTAAVDRPNDGLRSRTESTQTTSGSSTGQTTHDYVFDGVLYTRTEHPESSDQNDTGWLRYDDPPTVNETRDALDSLAAAEDALDDAETTESTETEVEGTPAVKATLDPSTVDRTALLGAKLSDSADYLDELSYDSFETTVYVARDDPRLLRLNATVELTAEGRGTAGEDLDAEIRVVENYSAYDEDVDTEPPEEALDAETVSTGTTAR